MDIKRLRQFFITYSRQKSLKFTLRARDVTAEEVFSPLGLLPALAKRAEQNAKMCLGHALALELPSQEKTTLGYTLKLNEEGPNFDLLLFMFDAFEELLRNNKDPKKVALDELLYE